MVADWVMFKSLNLDSLCVIHQLSCVCLFFIERATNSSLQTEDWGLNMEICDIVSATEDGCVVCWHKASHLKVDLLCTGGLFYWLFKVLLWLQTKRCSQSNKEKDCGEQELQRGYAGTDCKCYSQPSHIILIAVPGPSLVAEEFTLAID